MNNNNDLQGVAQKHFNADLDALPECDRRVVQCFIDRQHISEDTNQKFEQNATFGQRLTDKVATFGGSWLFIIIYVFVLLAWVLLNSVILAHYHNSFDPYPYILLNIFLSMFAAVQSPVIIMLQNRKSVKDRMDAEQNYEVNLKAEMEILSLHEKMDELCRLKWTELIGMQQEQIQLLTQLLKDREAAAGNQKTDFVAKTS